MTDEKKKLINLDLSNNSFELSLRILGNEFVAIKIGSTNFRLKKRVVSKITKKQACIYQGGNRTFEMMIEKNCPKQYKCLYNPDGDEPDIDKVMESLRSITK